MLPSEERRGQDICVSVPANICVTHRCQGEKKDGEYVVDSVFAAPDIKREVVRTDNADKTQNSLVYATRVRAINRAQAQIEREQARLKRLVDEWKDGKASYAEEALIDCA